MSLELCMIWSHLHSFQLWCMARRFVLCCNGGVPAGHLTILWVLLRTAGWWEDWSSVCERLHFQPCRKFVHTLNAASPWTMVARTTAQSKVDVNKQWWCGTKSLLSRKEGIDYNTMFEKKIRFMGGVRKTKNITFRTLSINYAH